LPHQVYKRPAAIVDALVVALKAKFFQDPQRRFVACPHGWPDSVAPRCERRIHHSVCSLSCIPATVESFQQFIGDLWLIEAASTDDQPAVPQRFVVGATANRE